MNKARYAGYLPTYNNKNRRRYAPSSLFGIHKKLGRYAALLFLNKTHHQIKLKAMAQPRTPLNSITTSSTIKI